MRPPAEIVKDRPEYYFYTPADNDTQWGYKVNDKGVYEIGDNFRYEGGFDSGFQYSGQGSAVFKDKNEK